MIKFEPIQKTFRITGSVEEIDEYNKTLMQDDVEQRKYYICTNCHTQVELSNSLSRGGKDLLCLTCQYKLSKILGVTRLDILNLVQRRNKPLEYEQNMNKKFVDNPYQE